jgi:hypothetical protein
MLKKWINNLLGNDSDHPESKDKAYLLELYDQLALAKANNKALSFKIVSIRGRGFQVKVGGLYAHISFEYMPWLYQYPDFWRRIAPYLTEAVFKGQVRSLSNHERIIVDLDASATKLKTAQLVEKQTYRCIVLKKFSANLLLELGNNFDWKCGSVIGSMHLSNFAFASEFDDINEGEIIATQFQGFDRNNKLVMGDKWVHRAQSSGDLNKLMHTIQPIVVRFQDRKTISFWLLDEYRCDLEITEEHYGSDSHVSKIKTYIRGLKDGAIIQCQILDIMSENRRIALKLSDEQYQEIVHPKPMIEKHSLTPSKILPSKPKSKLKKNPNPKSDKPLPEAQSKPNPKPILPAKPVLKEKPLGELDYYVGTRQLIQVKLDEKGQHTYWFQGIHPCLLDNPFEDFKGDRKYKNKLRNWIKKQEDMTEFWWLVVRRKGKSNTLYIKQNAVTAEQNLGMTSADLAIVKPIPNPLGLVMSPAAIPADLSELIGSEQVIIILKDEAGSRTYWFQDTYQCIPRRFYTDYLDQVAIISGIKRYIHSLESGSQIYCTITQIDSKKNKLIISLSPRYKNPDFIAEITDSELERLIGEVRTIRVDYSKSASPSFYLKTIYQCSFPMMALDYRQNKGRILKYLELIQPSFIECHIESIHPETGQPNIRFTAKQQEQLLLALSHL